MKSSKQKRHSAPDINRKLSAENEGTSPHPFMGPVSNGPQHLHDIRFISLSSKAVWLSSLPCISSSLQKKKRWSMTSFMGDKVAAYKARTSTHIDSFCDGCAMSPIIGPLWQCSICIKNPISLCATCYANGMHGFEKSLVLKKLQEEFAITRAHDLCKKVPTIVFTLLMNEVCYGQLDKFHFLSTWITTVVLRAPLHTLNVRGICIPNLKNETRSRLVHLLSPILAERSDIQVNMEWKNDHTSEDESSRDEGVERKEEVKESTTTLKIWITTTDEFPSTVMSSSPEEDSGLSPVSSPGSLLEEDSAAVHAVDPEKKTEGMTTPVALMADMTLKGRSSISPEEGRSVEETSIPVKMQKTNTTVSTPLENEANIISSNNIKEGIPTIKALVIQGSSECHTPPRDILLQTTSEHGLDTPPSA